MPEAVIDPDWITRDTPEYDEVCRILGPRARWVADERARQINRRWLKADCFIPDANGDHTVVFLKNGEAHVPTRSRRIRIPRDSFLARRRFLRRREKV